MTDLTDLAIAAVGIEDKDLTVLKSLLPLVGRLKSLNITLVDDLANAQVACLGRLPAERVSDLLARHGDRVILIYCCSRGETPPPGVRTLGHCPPRANELAEVLAAAAQQSVAGDIGAGGARGPVAEVSQLDPQFDPSTSLAGAIHAMLPRLLIDQPLAVKVPGAPCLLIDVHNGVRTAHGDPAWFSQPDFWRVAPATCELKPSNDATLLKECRRFPARIYQGLRFWGIMSVSQGRPLAEVAKATQFGLKKLPDFKLLPHHEWQPRLAETMVNTFATPASLAQGAGRTLAEINDFLNASAALGLLKTA